MYLGPFKLAESLLFRVVRRLLRPTLRFAVRQGLRVQEISELCKQELFAVGREELQANGKKETTSSLCLMTGLHRGDVKRLAEIDAESEDTLVRRDDLFTKIIGQWLGDRTFLDEKGRPRALSCGSTESEFNALCERVTTNFNAAAVLAELERLSLVRADGKWVTLLQDEAVYDSDVERGFELLGCDTEDLTTTVTSNLLRSDGETELHRRTAYDNIDSSQLPAIREWIHDAGVQFHRELRGYLAELDGDLNPSLLPHSGTRVRVAVTTFSCSAEVAEAPRTESTDRQDERKR
ncbi:DUF6502 family protein [bacterium]|nr:DUF6502 family protein [bacterium]